MKQTTKLFLLAELLDIITTMMNLRLPGMYEANPFMAGLPFWAWLIVKVSITIIIAVLMQRLNFGKKAWLIVSLASIPPIWNFGLLLYVLLI